jgi:hypothetical protein
MIAPVAIAAVTVPAVVVLEASALPFPITSEEAFSLIARSDPPSASIRRTCPVPVVPPVTASVGIPIAVHPNVVGPGTQRLNADDSRRWRWPNAYSEGYLSAANRESSHNHETKK